MGFRANRNNQAAPKLVLVAEAQDTIIPETFEAADAVVIMPGKTKLNGNYFQSINADLSEKAWGVADGTMRAGAKPPDGCDFIVFSALSPVASLPEDETTGKILQLESSMDDGLIRAVNDLPVDAVVIADSLEDGPTVTLHRLMILRHVTHLVSVPVIVPVIAGVTAAELKALREAGVDGVLLNAADTAAGKAKDIKKLIDALPARPSRKKTKTEALLPRGSAYREPEPEAPDKDDDDDWE